MPCLNVWVHMHGCKGEGGELKNIALQYLAFFIRVYRCAFISYDMGKDHE